MIGLMAAEYVNNREKRSNEKTTRELLDSAQNAAERRFALRWAEDHGVESITSATPKAAYTSAGIGAGGAGGGLARSQR